MKLKNILIIILLCNYLLSDYPDFQVIINNNPYPAELFIHSMHQPSGHMAIFDSNMNLYWSVANGSKGIDLKKNGNFITYFHKDPDENDGEDQSYWIVADQNMNETDTLKAVSGTTDYHDIRLLENGNYILQSYIDTYIDMSELVEGGNSNAFVKGILNIEEYDQNHNLIFSWYAFDFLDIAEYSNVNFTNNEFTWMHGNSIEVDYDNNIILSNRRSSEIIKIHRETGEVIWILGGPLNEFEIINDSFNGISKQHDVRRLDNGNILIFDNGNTHNEPVSRVVEYQIDEENKTAELVWEYQSPYNYVSVSMGSSQRLPNQNTLICWGNTLSDNGAMITEVNYDKEIVLEIVYDSGYNSYKVRKDFWNFNIPMLVGDPNLDETVNVLDIIYLVNYIFNYNGEKNIFDLYKIDINKDYSMDVTDIVGLVNIILD